MEFAGSGYAVPIAICVVAGALIAFELWRRRGGDAGGGAGASRGAGSGAAVGAADAIVSWHRRFEHTIFAWLEAADEALVGEAPTEVALTEFQSASRHYLKAAGRHPDETKRAELLEMHDCVQEVLAEAAGAEAAGAGAPGAEAPGAGADLPSSRSPAQAREKYETLRSRWVGHLRQLTTDDTFALQLLDANQIQPWQNPDS